MPCDIGKMQMSRSKLLPTTILIVLICFSYAGPVFANEGVGSRGEPIPVPFPPADSTSYPYMLRLEVNEQVKTRTALNLDENVETRPLVNFTVTVIAPDGSNSTAQTDKNGDLLLFLGLDPRVSWAARYGGSTLTGSVNGPDGFHITNHPVNGELILYRTIQLNFTQQESRPWTPQDPLSYTADDIVAVFIISGVFVFVGLPAIIYVATLKIKKNKQ